MNKENAIRKYAFDLSINLSALLNTL